MVRIAELHRFGGIVAIHTTEGASTQLITGSEPVTGTEEAGFNRQQACSNYQSLCRPHTEDLNSGVLDGIRLKIWHHCIGSFEHFEIRNGSVVISSLHVTRNPGFNSGMHSPSGFQASVAWALQLHLCRRKDRAEL